MHGQYELNEGVGKIGRQVDVWGIDGWLKQTGTVSWMSPGPS